MRRLVPTLLALCCSAALAGPAEASASSSSDFGLVTARGEFGSTAFTYQPSLVPVGARASVYSLSAPSYGTGVTLVVHGLVPGRDYGAHAHTKPCGPDGAAAGPHYQKRVDPVSPSVDPAYANPSNEIWLDLTTDRFGTGFSTTRVPWQFSGERRAASVVLHETHTHTHPGHAGTAGARLACLTVPF